MSIDYSAVGGIGIEATEELAKRLIEKAIITEEEWGDKYIFKESPSNKYKINIETAGSAFSGDLYWYFLIAGKNLPEIIDNAPIFIAAFQSAGVTITMNDLKVIAEGYVS